MWELRPELRGQLDPTCYSMTAGEQMVDHIKGFNVLDGLAFYLFCYLPRSDIEIVS